MDIQLRKIVVQNERSWCGCCGNYLFRGKKVLRIEVEGEVRLITMEHFLAWLQDEDKDLLTFRLPKEEI